MFPHCSSLSRGPPWGAEPGFELGPAVQQADALLFDLRRTLLELRRTLRGDDNYASRTTTVFLTDDKAEFLRVRRRRMIIMLAEPPLSS